MKKNYLLLLFLFAANVTFAQVGINTTTPEAQLDIKSSNQAFPSNKDGLLIPKIDTFPATNPTIAQQGMLVYLTTDVGTNVAGFYYWNNSPASWIPIKGANGGTLDQAYDFGGAGLGKTITADAGAVLINGTDGFVSTGTLNSGAVAPSGAGTRMFWNPRKGAFRLGSVNGTQWNDGNIGLLSAAMGYNSIASGDYSLSFGNSNVASGNYTTAFGTTNTASGIGSTVFGYRSSAEGEDSTVFGRNNISSSYGETVLGIGATSYTPSSNGATQFRTANATDRLFVIGNAIDANSNSLVDIAEKSDALIVLKNGLTRLPSTTNAMITAADGKAVVTKEYLQSSASGTLDQAYNFGGAGLGKTITADAGAVLINGTDGLVSTGTSGSGAIAPSGAGTKMFWNPRKAAFRTGRVIGTQWDDANIGLLSAAMGYNSIASGEYSFSFGNTTVASGNYTTAFGTSNTASGVGSTVFGYRSSADGEDSTVFGRNNTSSSYGETVLGIGATSYIPSTNGSTQFRTANGTDRLFTIGNAIDTNSNGAVDTAERSDAMIVLKNGLTRLPSTTNAMITAADGKAVVTKEYLQSTIIGGTLDKAYDFGGAGLGKTITADAGAVLINGTDGFVSTGILNSGAVAPPSVYGPKMFWNPRKAAFRAGFVTNDQWDDTNIGTASIALGNSVIASGASAAAFGFVTTAQGNFSTAFGVSTEAIGEFSTAFGSSTKAMGMFSTSFGHSNTAYSYGEIVLGIGATTYTPSLNGETKFRTANATDRLFVLGSAIDANNNSIIDVSERRNAMTVLKNGNVGIGTPTPGGQFELSLNEARKPGTTTWTIVSDQRLKSINGNYTKGLSEILQLNPIRFNYKNVGERKFEQKVLDTEFEGFVAHNQDGALGISGGFTVPYPTVSNISDVVAIGAGFRQSIFIKADGTVWACGINTYGKLGFGGTTSQTIPGQVTNLTGIIKVAGGQYHTLFLKNDGTAWSCGLNSAGQLGDGTNINRLVPVQVINVQNVNGIAASGFYHSLFSTSDNTFYACGTGGGQLGIGNTATQVTPTLVIDNCNPLAVATFDNSKLSVYPNPSSGIFNIDFDTLLEHAYLQIIDISGRIVIENSNFNSNETINISSLNSGIYIVKINHDGKTFSKKVSKQ